MDDKTPTTPLTPEQQEAIKLASTPRKRGKPSKEASMALKAAAMALRQLGHTNAQIAEQLHLTERQVQQITFAGKRVDPKDLEVFKSQFAGDIAAIVQALLTKANTEEFLDKVNGVQLVTATAILIDKLQVLTGKPNAITETRGVVEEVAGELKKLQDLKSALEQSIKIPEAPQGN